MESFEDQLQNVSEMLVSSPTAALERADRLASQSGDPRAFRLKAAALRALGHPQRAERAEGEGVSRGMTQNLRLARSAQRSGQYLQAKSIAVEHLRDNPGDLIAMTIAAEAALALGSSEEAEPMLREAVERLPAFAPASMLLAKLKIAQLRLREAAAILENLLRRAPHEGSAKRYLADVRAQMNEPSRAALLYQELLAAEPDNSADQFKYGQVLRYAGQKPESVRALRRSIALSPLAGHAWWPLVHHFPDEVTLEEEQQLRRASTSSGLSPDDRALIQAAVSAREHRNGNHQAAFEAIASAKALRARSSAYDPDILSRHVDELIAAYTPDVFQRLQPLGSTSPSPIFIVGMPRSGSTLLERILGQHSMIESLGEIPVLPRLVAREQADGTASYRSLMPGSVGDKLGELADWYLERSQEYRHSDKPRFTDKYNGNWIRAGLLRVMFPNAKILDIRRDPLDCCWAVFRSFVVSDFANDQRHLARYYHDYVRFMDAMAAVSPGGILTVSYEAIVADVEGQTRAILDFLGLGFEAACVNFHLSTAPVTTPSSEQVRRPINREGIGSSEPYRQWLQPLIDELGSALPDCPAD